MVFNFFIGNKLSIMGIRGKKGTLFFGIATNLLLLGYFKYTDFFIENLNTVFDSNIQLLHLALPLAISFFTFQQVAYLVDSYRGETQEYSFLHYATFVTFFPQLIAGPIVHHKEMMPQFDTLRSKTINYRNISIGLFIFSIGLFKKVVIADTFAQWASAGFDVARTLNLFEAWATSLSYTFQLYFDFSGYTDMAIGLALMFNIKLPINFNSPYKASNIQDFWRRWHITLSRFLKDYIYIPLGGNRHGNIRIYGNLLITFILGGLWHGAGWTFVFWGFLHAIALIIHRVWNSFGIKLWGWVGWFITFNFINVAWIFFRAKEWNDAIKIIKSMFSIDNIVLPNFLSSKFDFLTSYGFVFGEFTEHIKADKDIIMWLLVGFIITLLFKNSMQLMRDFKPTILNVIIFILTFTIAFYKLSGYSEFLYFRF